jgi:hypothetical protein
MTEQEWEGARTRLHELLIAAASARSTVTYGEAARVAFLGRFSARSGALMDLLGEVDEGTQRDRGFMLASLVVRADTGMPGEGYFRFAADEFGCDVLDRESLWRSEVEAVWSALGDPGEDR